MSKKILFIGSHPDDIEIGCGGTVAKMVSQGHECSYIILSNGEEGSIHTSPQELAQIRVKEAKNAAQALGVSDLHFMHFEDGLTGYSKESKINLIALIRELQPEIAFIHSSCDHHPDHEIAHRLCLAAINSASGPWFPTAGGTPHKVSKVYGYEVWNAINDVQMTIDISDFIEKKIESLSEHKTQIENFPYINAVKGLNQYRGAIEGTDYAEAFEVIKERL